MFNHFDQVIKGTVNERIQFGIVNGNSTIVHIKAGAGGSLYGYKNKYYKMAKSINKKYGYTVICASNPSIYPATLEDSFQTISNYCQKKKFNDYEVYYIGFSNGGNLGLLCGVNNDKIKRMLIINTPVFDYDKTIKEINSFHGEKMVFIYGSLDDCGVNTEKLKENCKNIDIYIIDGADHQFVGMTKEFIELPEKYILGDIK